MNQNTVKMISNNKLLKIVISIKIVFFTLSMFGQNQTKDATVHKAIHQRTDQIFDSLVKIRRDFHV